MVSTNNLKNGMTLQIDGELWRVDYFQHVKPGKGGAYVRTTLKGVQNGKTVDRTFRAGEEVTQAILSKRPLQYLYRDGDDFVFMDTEHFGQTCEPDVRGGRGGDGGAPQQGPPPVPLPRRRRLRVHGHGALRAGADPRLGDARGRALDQEGGHHRPGVPGDPRRRRHPARQR